VPVVQQSRHKAEATHVKILYAVHQFLPDFVGGTELDTWEVATRMRNRGHSVSIVTRAPGRGGSVTESRHGIPVTQLRTRAMTPITIFTASYGHWLLSRGFREVVEQMQPDLVHFQHLRGLPSGLVRWVKDKGIPVLISLRDYWFVCPNAQLIDYWTGELCTTPGEPVHCAQCAMVRVGLRSFGSAAPLLAPLMGVRNHQLAEAMGQADALLVYTDFVRRWFTEHGAPPDRIRLVPRGIPRPDCMPDSHRQPADGRVRFVYVGGLAWQKGIHTVIAAANSLPSNVELIIAGDETSFPDYVAHLRDLAVHPGIRFVGRLGRDKVYQTIADADAVLVPSLWYETFSMLLRESFAAGVPALVSDHGVLADAVTHGENGLRVASGDVDAWRRAMDRFVASADLRARLRAGVRPPLTMDAYIDNLEAEYARVL